MGARQGPSLAQMEVTGEKLMLWSIMLPIYAAVIGACAVWVWQLATFLKSGYWPPYSANAGLHFLTEAEWFIAPASWLGVHQVLGFLNAGVALILALFAAVMVAAVTAPKR